MQAITIRILTPTSEVISDTNQIKKQIDYSNEDSYNGEFIGGLREGEGIYTFKDGDVYQGVFEGGVFQGKGNYTTEQGDVYEGTFIAGLATGFGKIEFLTRDDVTEYNGQTLDGSAHGKGEVLFSSEDNYKGFLANGVFHGKGVLTYKNGDAYDGEYLNGVPTGQGKMLFASSNIVMNRNIVNGVDRAQTKELKENTFDLSKPKKAVVKVQQGQSISQAPRVANPNSRVMGSILGNLGLGKNTSSRAGGKQLAKNAASNSKAKATTKVNKQDQKTKRVSKTTPVTVNRTQSKSKKPKVDAKSIKKAKVQKIKMANKTKVKSVKKSSDKLTEKKKQNSKKTFLLKKTIKKAPKKKPSAKKTIQLVKEKVVKSKLVKVQKARKPRTSGAPDPNYATKFRTNVCGLTKRRKEGINIEDIFKQEGDQTNQSIKRSISMLKTVKQAEEYLRYKYEERRDEDEEEGNMAEEN